MKCHSKSHISIQSLSKKNPNKRITYNSSFTKITSTLKTLNKNTAAHSSSDGHLHFCHLFSHTLSAEKHFYRNMHLFLSNILAFVSEWMSDGGHANGSCFQRNLWHSSTLHQLNTATGTRQTLALFLLFLYDICKKSDL